MLVCVWFCGSWIVRPSSSACCVEYLSVISPSPLWICRNTPCVMYTSSLEEGFRLEQLHKLVRLTKSAWIGGGVRCGAACLPVLAAGSSSRQEAGESTFGPLSKWGPVTCTWAEVSRFEASSYPLPGSHPTVELRVGSRHLGGRVSNVCRHCCRRWLAVGYLIILAALELCVVRFQLPACWR